MYQILHGSQLYQKKLLVYLKLKLNSNFYIFCEHTHTLFSHGNLI